MAQRPSKAKGERDARHALNLQALAKIAAGRGLSRSERIRRGLTWGAAARSAGVSRQHLHRIARQMKREYLGRRDAS